MASNARRALAGRRAHSDLRRLKKRFNQVSVNPAAKTLGRGSKYRGNIKEGSVKVRTARPIAFKRVYCGVIVFCTRLFAPRMTESRTVL